MIRVDQPYLSEFPKETSRAYGLPMIATQAARAFGGEAGLKQLADADHAHAIKLMTWSPTALKRRDSKLLHAPAGLDVVMNNCHSIPT